MSEMVTLTAADQHTLGAYVAGNPSAPRALVVLQEIFGVNDHIRQVCDRFAQQGFHVIAPALFDRVKQGIELGYAKEDIQKGIALRAAIHQVQDTLMDVTAAARWLNREKVGVVGYCWGATLAWLCASKTQTFSAACGWYGAGIPAEKDAALNCPVQLHFGGKDASIPLNLVEELREAQPEVEIYTYAQADHGFGCDQRASYDAQAYKLAQEKTLEFFRKYL